ncbi:MAG: type II toxin-antitoxin system PemK/MazF family toxin [Nitrospirales bacterium]|nr:type II toxin-antitoxin system PemK/MazF family toxin [Nitrospirales bacterium]
MPSYVPKKGDFVVVSFDPQSGHEQKGRRPALVVSNTLFNNHTGLAMVCPLTNTSRDIPFHVKVPDQSSLTGYIMVEQIKSIDYVSRKIKFVEKAPQTVIDEVLGILDACLYANA